MQLSASFVIPQRKLIATALPFPCLHKTATNGVLIAKVLSQQMEPLRPMELVSPLLAQLKDSPFAGKSSKAVNLLLKFVYGQTDETTL